ncbi:MAG: hypothetical protein KFF68_06895, partial [Desulfosarcina sp.]|nr:hypothetical protein [Desulfosarcina sp.]
MALPVNGFSTKTPDGYQRGKSRKNVDNQQSSLRKGRRTRVQSQIKGALPVKRVPVIAAAVLSTALIVPAWGIA